MERDDGFIDVADVVRHFAPVDEWPPADRWAVRRVTAAGAAYAVHLDRSRGQGSEK